MGFTENVCGLMEMCGCELWNGFRIAVLLLSVERGQDLGEGRTFIYAMERVNLAVQDEDVGYDEGVSWTS